MTNELMQAKQLVESERRQRVDACGAAVLAVLQRYDCYIVGIPVFTEDGRVQVNVEICIKDDISLPAEGSVSVD